MASVTKAAKRPALKDDDQFARQIRDAKQNINALKKAQVSGTFLDCGANIGEVSIAISAFCDRVIAIEAHPATATVMKKRIKEAGVKNIEVINAAVTAKTGDTVFVSSPSFCAIGATARAEPRFKESKDYYRKVKTVALADLVKQYKPNAIKIDIEGSEFEALADIKLPNYVRKLVVEFHGRPERILPILRKIKGQGYDVDGFNRETTYTLQTVQFTRRELP